MNLQSLVPARTLALKYGVKSIVHGPPGSGKTPLINTAPRPILLCVEPGMLSMRNSNVPTFCAPTPDKIEEFFAWFFQSNESRNFDTFCYDSVSEAASVYLEKETNKTTQGGNQAHGLKAYGNMAEGILKNLRKVFFMPEKHTYLICKQGTLDLGNGQTMLVPGFPGKELGREVPHLYDLVLHLGIKNVPGVGQIKAFQTDATFDILARDRSGKLNLFEPCDLTAMFKKAMS